MRDQSFSADLVVTVHGLLDDDSFPSIYSIYTWWRVGPSKRSGM